MNCHDAETLLLAEREGSLPAPEATRLAAHLEGCASCRRLRADLAEGFRSWTAETAARPVPNAQAAWRDLRTALHEPPESRKTRTGWRWVSFGLPLAAAAAVAVLLTRPYFAGRPADAGPGLARVQYVEPGTPGASTLVYEDPESGWLVIWTADADNGTGL